MIDAHRKINRPMKEDSRLAFAAATLALFVLHPDGRPRRSDLFEAVGALPCGACS